MDAAESGARRSGARAAETSERGSETRAGGRTIELTPETVALMLKICLRYRASLPVYLQAVRAEVDAVDSLIAQLR